jgi:TolA-binding protein
VKQTLFVLFTFLLIGLSAQSYVPNQHPDFYYNQAIAHYQSGDYKVAKHLLDEYLEVNTTPEALYYRAMSAIKSEQKSGEHYVRTFLADYPIHPLAHKAQFELAHNRFKLKKYQAAALAYSSIDPKHLDKKQREQALFEKGYSFLQMKVMNQAKEAFKGANELKGDYKYSSAYYLGTLSEGKEAETLFLEASESDEWKMRAAVYLSQTYLSLSEYEKLEKWNTPLLNQDKTVENYDLHIYTAEANYRQKKYGPAVRLYSTGIALGARKPDSETLFKLGHSYYEIGEKQNAIDQLKKSGLNETATGQASAFQLGRIYTELGQFANALHAYEIAGSSAHDKAIQEEAKFLAAKISIRLEQYGQAIQKLEGFIKEFPASKRLNEANELLSSAYLNTSNFDLVIAHFEKSGSASTVLRKNYQKVTLIKGMQSFSDRQIAAAITYLQKSVNTPVVTQLQVDAYYWLGECYFVQGETDKAKGAYQKAKSLDGSHALSDYGLGYLNYNEKQYGEAKTNFQAFLRKDRSSKFRADASLRISDCDYALKNYDAALTGYGSVVGSSVAQDYVNFQIGLIHQLNGRTDQAVAAFRKVVVLPKSTYRDNALFQIGQSYFETAKFEDAKVAFSSYMDQFPNEPTAVTARQKRGQCHFNTGNMAAAKADYIYVLDNHIKHPAAQNALLGIQELQKQGQSIDFDKYLAAYRTAHPDDSSLASIEFEQAKTLYFSQNYTGAISQFETLLLKNKESTFKEEIIYYLGDAYQRIGNASASNKYYEMIIDMAPSDYLNRVLEKRGRLLLETQQGDKAIQNYTMLKTQSKNRKETYLADEGLMKTEFLLKKWDGCIERAQEIISAEWKPSNAESQAFLFIGKSYQMKNNYGSAVDEYLKVINGSTDELAAESKYRIGEIQHLEGKYQSSIETLFQLNSNYGTYQSWVGKSFLLIADNYLKMNELLQAKATLNSLIDNFPDEKVKAEARQKLNTLNRQQEAQVVKDTLR